MQLNLAYLLLIVTFQSVIEAQNYLLEEQQPPFAQFAPQSILTNYTTSSTTEKAITTTTTTTTTTTPITTTTTPYTTTTTSTTTQPTTTSTTTTSTTTQPTTTTIPSTTSTTYTIPSAIYPTNSPSVQTPSSSFYTPEAAPSSRFFGLPPAVDISETTINPFYQPMHQSPLNFFQAAQRKTLDFLNGGGSGGAANAFNLGDFGGALTSILTPMAGAAAAALTAGGGASLISLPNASIQPTLQKTFVVNLGGNNPPLIVQGNAYQPGASAGGLGGGNHQARSGSGFDNFNVKGSLSQLAQSLGYPRYPNYPPRDYRQLNK